MVDFDMPLDQLRAYRGNTPLPSDHQAFWDLSLEEARRHDPQARLVPGGPASTKVECFDVFFKGLDGSEIHAKVLRPRGAVGGPALFQFHGYTNDSGNWIDKLSWAAEGFTVIALDCRGQAGRSMDASARTGNSFLGHLVRGLSGASARDHIYWHIYTDIYLLTRVAKDLLKVDASRMASMGTSQGGGLALICASLEPGIVKVASQFPFLANFKRSTELAYPRSPYQEVREYFRKHDPEHLRAELIYTRFGYIDAIHLAPRIRAELLMAITLEDDICPPSSQFAAYNQVSSAKQMALYPDYGHEDMLPGWHEKVWAFLGPLAR